MAIAKAFASGVKALLGGGELIKNGLEFVNKRWPPKMSEEDRIQAEMVVKEALHNQQLEIEKALQLDEQLFNERTIALEGTAKDLKAVPYVGALIIFLRGAFRPVFSYFTGYMDYLYFMESSVRVYDSNGLLERVVTTWTDRQETLLLVMNLLVLIFFFGERAMKNVLPIIIEMFATRKPGQP